MSSPLPRTPTGDPGLSHLLSRRSVSPRRLVHPGPGREQLELIVRAALRAPDHDRLRPWRVIEFPETARQGLARLFESEKRRRSVALSELDLVRAREHAVQPPVLLAFVTRLVDSDAVPPDEQRLSAGAALGYLLLACHFQGFAAMVLSGQRCRDPHLCSALGLEPDESLAGFVSIGTLDPRRTPKEIVDTEPDKVWSQWHPASRDVHGNTGHS